MASRVPDTAIVQTMNRMAGHELAAERVANMLPVLEETWRFRDLLHAVDTGELPPASAFDPRWRPDRG